MLTNIWAERPVASILTAVTITAAIRLAEQRPRGWLTNPQALRVGPSLVPNGGRGVFAVDHLPADTVLGTYPVRKDRIL